MNITQLRALVNKGYTISNKNLLKKQFGQKNYNELCKLAKDADIEKIDVPSFNDLNSWLGYIPNGLEMIKNSLKSARKLKPWSRIPEFGKGNWNSEYMQEFRNIRTSRDRIPADKSKSTEVRRLFDGLKPLGCDEIRYRGENYILSSSREAEHFEKLKNLKVDDIYEPRGNFYTTSDKSTAEGFRDRKGLNSVVGLNRGKVMYEILIPKDAKVIASNSNIDSEWVETVLDDRAGYKIIDKILEGDNLYIKCEYIP